MVHYQRKKLSLMTVDKSGKQTRDISSVSPFRQSFVEEAESYNFIIMQTSHDVYDKQTSRVLVQIPALFVDGFLVHKTPKQ